MAKRKAKPEAKPVTKEQAKLALKRFACVADLLTTAQHYLGEINQPYVLIVEGIPELLTNVPISHARYMIQDAYNLQDKLNDVELESKVEKLTAIPPDEGGATGANK